MRHQDRVHEVLGRGLPGGPGYADHLRAQRTAPRGREALEGCERILGYQADARRVRPCSFGVLR